MEVCLTPDQAMLIREAIAAGRIAHAEDAARQAMALWEERERRRAELLARVDAAEASLARGEGMEITETSMREFSEDVKQRGLARMYAERITGP